MRTRLQLGSVPAQATELDDDLPGLVNDLAARLADARTVVLTGAGISTESGIPDYRSPDAPPRTPMTLEMFLSSPHFRRHYWARNHLGWRHMDAARPNAGHLALSSLQRLGAVSTIITQNVDMLHTKAGSTDVVELHGNYGSVRCRSCDRVMSRWALAELLDARNPEFARRHRALGAIEVAPDADAVLDETGDFVVADCPSCGGILKPDIVYFGENARRELVARSFAAVDDADVLLVVGSSLTVSSGHRFVRHAHKTGTPVLILNRGSTRGDELATRKIDHRSGEVLPRLVAELSRGLPSA